MPNGQAVNSRPAAAVAPSSRAVPSTSRSSSVRPDRRRPAVSSRISGGSNQSTPSRCVAVGMSQAPASQMPARRTSMRRGAGGVCVEGFDSVAADLDDAPVTTI
jgi:hypothetical protein